MTHGTERGKFGCYKAGDTILIEVDMSARCITFYNNSALLCQAEGIKRQCGPLSLLAVCPNVVVTIQSHDVQVHSTPLHVAALSNTHPAVVSGLLDVGGVGASMARRRWMSQRPRVTRTSWPKLTGGSGARY